MRAALPMEIEDLARIWSEGWQDAHLRILPAELARHRTLESFGARLREALETVRVAGAPGAALGFSMVRGDELYQLYVAAHARGTGIAAALLTDAEARLAAGGVATAWLACAIGNVRAARFYEKHDWRRVRTTTIELPLPDGVFPLDVWRYEKHVGRA